MLEVRAFVVAILNRQPWREVLLCPMPTIHPQGDALLDVTLHRDGLTRSWTISHGSRPTAWDCRVSIPDAVVTSACFTDADASAAVCAWTGQIKAAKAEGWT